MIYLINGSVSVFSLDILELYVVLFKMLFANRE